LERRVFRRSVNSAVRRFLVLISVNFLNLKMRLGIVSLRIFGDYLSRRVFGKLSGQKLFR
jgi:hypothetical protein